MLPFKPWIKTNRAQCSSCSCCCSSFICRLRIKPLCSIGLNEMSTTSTIRAVIFDMDGVLTDSEPLINAAAIAMFAQRGLRVRPEDFFPFIGTGEDRYIGGVAELYNFPLDLPAAKHRTYEIYLELVPARLEAFPGARQLVNDCRQAGLRVSLASSADRVKVAANLSK